MKYKAIRNYSDVPSSPIKITKGEILDFIKESDPHGDWCNWIYCKGENKEGWVPKQILEIHDKIVTVLNDYSAYEHTLTIGEILILEYELNGWIWCYKESEPGKAGWAPLNHLSKY